MSGEFNFDNLTPIEIPVSVGKVPYVLKEATELSASKYRSAQAQSGRFEDGEFAGVNSNIGDLQALLVSLCLFDEEGKSVPLHVIQNWPSRIVKPLFEKAKQISELEEEEETEEGLHKQQDEIEKKLKKLRGGGSAKNEPSDMTDGSE